MTGLMENMASGWNVSLVLEAVLALLLAATVLYCAQLERRLKGLRQDQAALAGTITALNAAILRAQGSLTALREAAAEAGDTLGKGVTRARALADELSLLTAAGERIASRMEAARGQAPAPAPRIIRHETRNPMADALRAVR
jgi:hypothetical protein